MSSTKDFSDSLQEMLEPEDSDETREEAENEDE